MLVLPQMLTISSDLSASANYLSYNTDCESSRPSSTQKAPTGHCTAPVTSTFTRTHIHTTLGKPHVGWPFLGPKIIFPFVTVVYTCPSVEHSTGPWPATTRNTQLDVDLPNWRTPPSPWTFTTREHPTYFAPLQLRNTLLTFDLSLEKHWRFGD